MLAFLQGIGLAARLAVVHLTPESALAPDLAAEFAGRVDFAPEAFANCGVGLGLGTLIALPPRAEKAGPSATRLLATGVLVGGGVGPFRSVALLTEDAGRTWREVMTPVGGSAVSEVVTHGDEIWALVAFEVEGPGPVEVVHSADAGRTFTTLTTVVKREPLGVVRGLAFTDAQHGRLVVDYEGMGTDPPTELQVTADGGKTWRVTGPAPAPAESAPRATENSTRASDGTEWRFGASTESVIPVERRSPGPSEWRAVARLPARWTRTPAGALVPCPNTRRKPAKAR